MNFKALRKLEGLPSWLNWLLAVIEPLVVLVIAVLIFYVVYWLIFGPEQDGRQARLMGVLKGMNDNWKVGLLLLVLLFYRTIRTFLEQMEKGPWGVTRPLRGDPKEEANPQRENKS